MKPPAPRIAACLRVHITRRFSCHAPGRTPEAALAKLIPSAEAHPYRPERPVA